MHVWQKLWHSTCRQHRPVCYIKPDLVSVTCVLNVAGPVLDQLLACPSLCWSPNRVVELLEASVTLCTSRAVAAAEVLPRVIAAATAALLQAASADRPEAQASTAATGAAAKLLLAATDCSYSYLLHFGNALTVQLLQELDSTAAAGSVYSSQQTVQSEASNSSSSSRPCVSDFVLAAAQQKIVRPLVQQLQQQRGSMSPPLSGSLAGRICNARVVGVSVSSSSSAAEGAAELASSTAAAIVAGNAGAEMAAASTLPQPVAKQQQLDAHACSNEFAEAPARLQQQQHAAVAATLHSAVCRWQRDRTAAGR